MSSQHPSLDITGSSGNALQNKKIALGVTGSVAAVRSVEIARLLMRQGAAVFPLMTPAACGIIHPNLMEWATGHKVVTELSGQIEHVALAGNVEGKVDLILIAPATANTIGKIAAGIDDTAVTTLATTGLGEGIPMLIVPAMHEPMYRHPIVMENIRKLKNQGIMFLAPRLEEGKAKIPSEQEIADTVAGFFLKTQVFKGKRILITAGRTVEYLDPIRVISNRGSGKMGMALAQEAQTLGADVTVIYGKGTASVPSGVKVLEVDTTEEMKSAVMKELKNASYDVMIAAAAPADWRPKQRARKKISTHESKSLTITLEPTPKIIDAVKQLSPALFLVAFRALHALTEQELVDNGYARMQAASADLIAINDVSRPGEGFETETNALLVVDSAKKTVKLPLAAKNLIAGALLKIVAEKMGLV